MNHENPLPQPQTKYPESDGEPMVGESAAVNWIIRLYSGLTFQFRNDANVSVIATLFWYPDSADRAFRLAPDVMVVFGRQERLRTAYRQWEESGISPQVVFEILRDSKNMRKCGERLNVFERYGVEECYFLDPHHFFIHGWRRSERRLISIPDINAWTSPRLGIQFNASEDKIQVIGANGMPFRLLSEELGEHGAGVQETNCIRATVPAMAAKLRELGVDPDAVLEESRRRL